MLPPFAESPRIVEQIQPLQSHTIEDAAIESSNVLSAEMAGQVNNKSIPRRTDTGRSMAKDV